MPFPVHLNWLRAGISNVRLVALLDYPEMQQALADGQLVLTDSGGL